MDNEFSLDDVLNDNGQTQDAAPAQAEPLPDEATASTTGEPEQSEPAPETVAPPAAETSEPEHVPIAALKGERAKRQQAEQLVQQYEAYFQQLQQQTQPQEEDPVALFAERVKQALYPEFQQSMLMQKAQLAERFARQQWADYDEKVQLVVAEAERNPFLRDMIAQADDPAAYAYNVGQQIAQARGFATPAPSREQLEAEIREKIMAEIGMAPKPVPTSLANQRSVGTRSAQASTTPFSIDDVLG